MTNAKVEFHPNPNFSSELSQATKQALEKIKYPEHGTVPTVDVNAFPKIEMTFCCERLKEKVQAAMKKE